MQNPYKAWNVANDTIKEINTICMTLNKVLKDIEIAPLHKLVILGFLMQIQQSTDKYLKQTKEMMDGK